MEYMGYVSISSLERAKVDKLFEVLTAYGMEFSDSGFFHSYIEGAIIEEESQVPIEPGDYYGSLDSNEGKIIEWIADDWQISWSILSLENRTRAIFSINDSDFTLFGESCGGKTGIIEFFTSIYAALEGDSLFLGRECDEYKMAFSSDDGDRGEFLDGVYLAIEPTGAEFKRLEAVGFFRSEIKEGLKIIERLPSGLFL